MSGMVLLAGVLLAAFGTAWRIYLGKRRIARTNRYGVEEFDGYADMCWNQMCWRASGLILVAGVFLSAVGAAAYFALPL